MVEIIRSFYCLDGEGEKKLPKTSGAVEIDKNRRPMQITDPSTHGYVRLREDLCRGEEKFMSFSIFLQMFFSHQISSEDFSSYVKDIWNSNLGFVRTYNAPQLICDYIWRLSFDKLITEHGRPEQPSSISQHLFGDENSVSARLVYDLPVTCGRESLEYHTHPVDTIIIVIAGSGIYSFIQDDFIQGIDVALNRGKILFFPANTVHTIKQIGLDGLETLNMTNVLNQPSYRDEIDDEKRKLLPDPSRDFSQEYDNATEEFISYEVYLNHLSPR